jgi:hypothetical protein
VEDRLDGRRSPDPRTTGVDSDRYRPPTVIGAYVLEREGGEVAPQLARETILATGGSTRVSAHDQPGGLARRRHRHGARGAASEPEYIQFHPTRLRAAGEATLSEALRAKERASGTPTERSSCSKPIRPPSCAARRRGARDPPRMLELPTHVSRHLPQAGRLDPCALSGIVKLLGRADLTVGSRARRAGGALLVRRRGGRPDGRTTLAT